MYIVKRFEQVVDLENRYIKTDYYYIQTQMALRFDEVKNAVPSSESNSESDSGMILYLLGSDVIVLLYNFCRVKDKINTFFLIF